LDGALVALRRAGNRLLDAVAHGMQEPADVRRMVADAEGALDDHGDALARPNLPAEPVRLGSPLQERGNLTQLFGRESRLPTGSGMTS
jgi:hypothetical protein